MFNTIRPVILGAGGASPSNPARLSTTRNLLSWKNPATVYKNTTDKIKKDISASVSQSDLCYYKFENPYIAPLRTHLYELFDRFFYRYKNFKAWNATANDPATDFFINALAQDYDEDTINWNTRITLGAGGGGSFLNLRKDQLSFSAGAGAGSFPNINTPLNYEINRSTLRSRSAGIATITMQQSHDLAEDDLIHMAGLTGGYNGQKTLLAGSTGNTLVYASSGTDEAATADTGGYFQDDPSARNQMVDCIWPMFSFSAGVGSTQTNIKGSGFNPLQFATNSLVGLYAYMGGPGYYGDARQIISNDNIGNGQLTVASGFTTVVFAGSYIEIGMNVYGLSIGFSPTRSSDEFEMEDLELSRFADNLEWVS